MNVEIVSLNPFRVEFRLYNLLGEVDGHPMVCFDMATGNWRLFHDKTFRNLVSMADHPSAGQEIVLVSDSEMLPTVARCVAERMRSTGFHDGWATAEFNRFFEGDVKYPSYFFTMWNRGEGGEMISCRHIGEAEYAALRAWKEMAR